MKNQKLFLLGLITFTLMTSGCSVKMAGTIHDPYKKATLTFGRDRAFVISELGQPERTETKAGFIVDQYTIQRNSQRWGYFRAVLYSVLDVGTFGLWELIGIPLERFIQTDEMVTIEYDKNGQIKRIHFLEI